MDGRTEEEMKGKRPDTEALCCEMIGSRSFDGKEGKKGRDGHSAKSPSVPVRDRVELVAYVMNGTSFRFGGSAD